MSLAAQETKYGLKNSGKFTRSHCDCDEKFYQCLKNVNSMLSTQVGKVYFNVLGHQCFKEDHPATRCKSSIKSRCVHYDTDTSQSKTFQWFDNPWF
jgi:secretory phospholipase A2